jgi:hypothetical protein
MTAPKLRAGGRAFWDQITENFEPSPGELLLLTEACRAIDRCDALAAKDDPRSVAEHRQQALLLSRLLGQLQIPVTPATSARGQAGNAARWAGHERRS